MIDDRDEAVVFHTGEMAEEQEEAEDSVFSSEPRQASDGSLGPGPLRFAAKGERPMGDQIASLSTEQKQCFDNLKRRWKERHPDKPLSDEMILRFARCSPGRDKFNERSAWNVMQRFDRRYLVLTASRLEPQLLSKTLFPVPGLFTKDGHHVFFMRASRYFPSQTPTKVIIDNLAYCMTCMMEEEKSCTEGIAFLCYMHDWNRANFSMDYMRHFMRTLQGRVPVRLRVFLIVDPPAWFFPAWAMIKPLLFQHFRDKVLICKEEDLGDFLIPGFEEFLPDDMSNGCASTGGLVADFVTYRKYVEEHHKLIRF